jgi:hypothetical protein
MSGDCLNKSTTAAPNLLDRTFPILPGLCDASNESQKTETLYPKEGIPKTR